MRHFAAFDTRPEWRKVFLACAHAGKIAIVLLERKPWGTGEI
nr:MAG TPA: hypothetical protein [Bacteriophage sp.]